MLQMFSIKDLRADCFISPWFDKNVPQAIRTVVVAVGDPESNLSKFASDFALYQVGTFDPETGVVAEISPPINLGILDGFKMAANQGVPNNV